MLQVSLVLAWLVCASQTPPTVNDIHRFDCFVGQRVFGFVISDETAEACDTVAIAPDHVQFSLDHLYNRYIQTTEWMKTVEAYGQEELANEYCEVLLARITVWNDVSNASNTLMNEQSRYRSICGLKDKLPLAYWLCGRLPRADGDLVHD